MAPIRIGFVGLSNQGWASWMLATPLLQPPLSSAYSLSAVSTTNPESASTTAEKYSKLTGGSVKAYHGPTTSIASDKELDVIAVAVKAPSHKDAAMPVIEAGKNLFLEWPAGKNLKETMELAEAAKNKGIRTMVGTQGRQSPLLKKLKSIIESGEIGRVRSTTVTARLLRELFIWGPYVSQSAQYATQPENGATLLDIAVGHFVDCFTFVLGPFASLTAVLANQHPTAEIVDATGNPIGQTIKQTDPHQVVVAGTLSNGTIVSVHWRGGLETRAGKAGTPFIWTIDGEKGSIRVESDDPSGSFIHVREPTMYLNGEEVKIDVEDGLSNPGRAWAEFAKGIEGDYPTLEDAVKTRRVLAAITKSSEEGRRIDLELDL